MPIQTRLLEYFELSALDAEKDHTRRQSGHPFNTNSDYWGGDLQKAMETETLYFLR